MNGEQETSGSEEDRLIGPALEWVAGTLAVVMLASWAPQYLAWPWWCDTDDFANLARSWSLGVLPYRDIRAGNFPLPVYVFWMLGKLFGWGRPVVFNAFDVGLISLFGVAIVLWSRKIFGRSLPGIVGFLAFTAFYFGLDYGEVAQRDWHGPLCAVLSLMVLQTRPGRGGFVVSALLYSLALGYRPHTVVFFPAMVIALEARVRASGGAWRTSLRVVLEWGSVVTLGFVVVFLPLILSGIADDFIQGFLISARGAKTSSFSLSDRFGRLAEEISITKHVAVPLGVWLFARCSSESVRAVAWPWVVALAGAFIYRPLHPIPHNYLWQPLMLFWSINLGLLLGLILTAAGTRPALKLMVVILLMMVAVPERPRYCHPKLSLSMIPRLLKGEDSLLMPPGCVFRGPVGVVFHPWQDYTDLLTYLRREVSPLTRVANALRSQASINGPSGRISPFSAETGLLWAWAIDPSYKDKYLQDLEAAKNSIVVWIPREAEVKGGHHPIDFLKETIVRLYEPAVKFGEIEVWKRKLGR